MICAAAERRLIITEASPVTLCNAIEKACGFLYKDSERYAALLKEMREMII